MLDISTAGGRAASSVKLHCGTVLKLSLFLPDYQWPLRMEAAGGRWVEEREFGLEFSSIRLAQRERLRALLMKVKASRLP